MSFSNTTQSDAQQVEPLPISGVSTAENEIVKEEIREQVTELENPTDLASGALAEESMQDLERFNSNLLVSDAIPVQDFSQMESPEVTANIFSKLTFWWVNPLCFLAWKRPLQQPDLWPLPHQFAPDNVHERFTKEWDREIDLFNALQKEEEKIRVRHTHVSNRSKSMMGNELERAGSSNLGFFDQPFATASPEEIQKRISKGEKPSLIRALFRMVWKPWLVSGACDFIADGLQLATPMVMKALISYLQNPTLGYSQGYGYAMGITLFLLQLFNIFFTAHYWQQGQKTGFTVRSAIVSTIYNKTLLLNASSRLDFNTGKVVNIMGTDAARIDGMSWSIHDLWSAPLVIIVGTALLIINLGPSALVGVAFLIVMFPIQGFITRRLMILRRKVNVFTDRRVKVTGELIAGIRAIKFQGWEAAFMQRLTGGKVHVPDFPQVNQGKNQVTLSGDDDWDGVRQKELDQVRSLMITRAFMLAVVQAQPVLASMLSFLTYTWVGNTLTPAIVFSSIALFNTMRQPLMTLPRVANALADALVSVKRVESLLFAPEIAGAQFQPKSGGDDAIVLQKASFQWDTPPEIPPPKPKKKNKLLTMLGLDSGGGPPSGATIKGGTMRGGTMGATGKSINGNIQGAIKSVPEMEMVPPVKIDNSKPSNVVETNGNNIPSPLANSSLATLGRTAAKRGKLLNVNLSVPQGSFVCVIGPVGSGKSSLLSAIVGEMSQIPSEGLDPKDVRIVRGRVAYCPQSAWIQNATVRENICFGKSFDVDFYNKVVKASALEHDLTILPKGDETEIGERGINISGGQKARVSLARSCYSRADVVVLDDPLAAVDTHVASHLVSQCLLDLLKDKTRILATHRLDVLKHADWIVSVVDGEIVEQGTLQDLLSTNGYVSSMAQEFGLGGHEVDHVEEDKGMEFGTKQVEKTDNPRQTLSWKDSKKKAQATQKAGKLMSEEEREVGAVKFGVYKDYFYAAGGIIGLFILVLLMAASQGAGVAVNVWLGLWSSYSLGVGDLLYELVYVALGIAQALLALSVGIVLAIVGLKASKNIHDKALWSVMRSPTRFFDVNPVGRIMARFSRDVDALDNNLPMAIQMSLMAIAGVIASLVTISVVFPWFLIAILVTMPVYYYIQAFYRRTSRELKRLDSISRSPLYAHFAETLTGLSTIRAFGVTSDFSQVNMEKLDANGRAYYLQQMVTRWNALRLGVVSSLLVLVASMFCVAANTSLPAGIVGLVLTYAVQVSQMLNMAVRTSADTEVQFNSVERLLYYANSLEQEAPLQGQVPDGWIWRGDVEIRDAQLRYRAGLPLVLQGLNVNVKGGQRVGIVGRTGSGKSSLLQALFRLVELEAGQILIDGVDIVNVGLGDLRDRLSIVSQDATLFSGTVRSNLDPFGKYDDLQLWRALDSCGDLARVLRGDERGLEYPVAENGENFSVGQRQLLCLGRALLRGAKVVCLDEASASVDLATDAFIQTTLREDAAFKDKTILTIAHRLNTVMDYDLIIVLVEGRVAEYGSPSELISRGGLFAGMVSGGSPS